MNDATTTNLQYCTTVYKHDFKTETVTHPTTPADVTPFQCAVM